MKTTILNINAYLTEASKAILAKKRDTTLFDYNLRVYRNEFGELEDSQYERVGVLCQTFGFLVEHVGELKGDEVENSEKLVATIINELSYRDLLYDGILGAPVSLELEPDGDIRRTMFYVILYPKFDKNTINRLFGSYVSIDEGGIPPNFMAIKSLFEWRPRERSMPFGDRGKGLNVPMNWQQLKDFCNSLNDNQLSQKVILWREDEAITNIYAEELDDDHYIHEDDEDGCYTLDAAQHPVEQLKKVYDKGFPLLFEDF